MEMRIPGLSALVIMMAGVVDSLLHGQRTMLISTYLYGRSPRSSFALTCGAPHGVLAQVASPNALLLYQEEILQRRHDLLGTYVRQAVEMMLVDKTRDEETRKRWRRRRRRSKLIEFIHYENIRKYR